jgi:ATP-dependent Lon protease
LEEQLREVQEDLETSRQNEVNLTDQLDQAQAVARALQNELHQALYMYRATNPHSPYEMTVIRTDPDYVDALGRICRR